MQAMQALAGNTSVKFSKFQGLGNDFLLVGSPDVVPAQVSSIYEGLTFLLGRASDCAAVSAFAGR